ncbi:MAG TPA: hypothetical protein VGA70_10650 [Longimicrobiales bacterium]|jgi:hypothetical protein
MRRSAPLLAAATCLTMACSSGEVVITAEIEVPDPSQEDAMRSQTLADVEIQLIPFDRDVVFDSLTRTAANAEPQIPPELVEARDSIATAQARWQALETRWGTLRDTLRDLNETMSRYSRGEATYVALYGEYGELEGQLGRVDRQRQAAFEHFDGLQQASIDETNRIRIERENWADEAFIEVDAIFRARERATGRVVMADTTNAQGIAQFTGLKKGQWWVHARYQLPYTELYWNVMVDVQGGEPVTIRLTRANALERPSL